MKKIEYKIRKVQMCDFEDCICLFKLLGKRYTLDTKDRKIKKIFLEYTKHKSKLGYVAYNSVDNEIIGCLFVEIASMLCQTGKQGRGEGMVVKPKYRGNEIGKSLLLIAANEMKKRKVLNFVVRTPYNWRSLNFYRKIPQLEERGIYFYFQLN